MGPQRYFVVIDRGVLSTRKRSGETPAADLINLSICTVKPLPDVDRLYSFQVSDAAVCIVVLTA
jgi:hypothetical protein